MVKSISLILALSLAEPVVIIPNSKDSVKDVNQCQYINGVYTTDGCYLKQHRPTGYFDELSGKCLKFTDEYTCESRPELYHTQYVNMTWNLHKLEK